MKLIDEALLDSLTLKARDSERLRSHYNLHESLEAPIHRLLIATEPGTYFQPHRHFECDKWELMILMRGSGLLLTFNAEGVVIDRYIIGKNCDIMSVEVQPEMYHCFVPLESGTIFMEVKAGPYVKPTGSDWGNWAPAEGDDGVQAYMEKLLHAQPGDPT